MLPAIPQLAVSLAREKYALRGHRLIGDRAVKHLVKGANSNVVTEWARGR